MGKLRIAFRKRDFSLKNSTFYFQPICNFSFKSSKCNRNVIVRRKFVTINRPLKPRKNNLKKMKGKRRKPKHNIYFQNTHTIRKSSRVINDLRFCEITTKRSTLHFLTNPFKSSKENREKLKKKKSTQGNNSRSLKSNTSPPNLFTQPHHKLIESRHKIVTRLTLTTL